MTNDVSKLHHYNPLWRVPVTWRTTFSWDYLTGALSPPMSRALRSAARTGILDGVSRTTLRALEVRGLCDGDSLSREGLIVSISQCSLSTQCELLQLPRKEWHLPKARSPEIAVMMTRSQNGAKVAYCEGGAVLLVLYCLCFERLYRLSRKHWGSAEEARSFMYTSILCYGELLEQHPELPDQMVADIANTREQELLRSFDILKSWQGSGDGWAGRDWVAVDRELVLQLFRALGNDRCAAIARRFLQDPFAFTKGWPDLVWVEGETAGLIEVKTKDRLHISQIITIPEIREASNLPVEVAQVSWHVPTQA